MTDKTRVKCSHDYCIDEGIAMQQIRTQNIEEAVHFVLI